MTAFTITKCKPCYAYGIERSRRWFDVARARLDAAIADMNKQTLELFAI